MKNTHFAAALFLIVMMLCSVLPTAAQENVISPEKRALIVEILNHTGIAKFTVNLEINSTKIDLGVKSLIEKDSELSSEQKQDLFKLEEDAKARLNQMLADYNTNPENSNKLFQEVCIELFVKNFTESELKEMNVFYQTPTGKKSVNFLLRFLNEASNDYSKVSSENMKKILESGLEKEREKILQKIKEIKAKKGVA